VEPAWATTVARARITVAVVLLLAAVVLVVAMPPTVLIPIMTVLVAGLFVGGLFLLVERLTRPMPGAPPRPDGLARGDGR
jgi:hypothetical protein